MTKNISAKETNYSDFIRIINNDTQKEVNIEIKEITTNLTPKKIALSTSDTSHGFTEELCVRFNILELEGINPLGSIDTTTEHGDFEAYLKITYDTSGTTTQPKMRVNTVEGHWKCLATHFSASFQNREVLVKQGNWLTDSNCTLVKRPTSNTFKYTTGWSYVSDLPKTDYSGVHARSTAKAVISGMGGGYTLEANLSRKNTY